MSCSDYTWICSFGIYWWCLAPITLEYFFFIFLSWLNTYDKPAFLLTSPLHAWAHCWNWHPRAKARCWSSKGERGGRREANSRSISEGAHEIWGWVLAMSLIRVSHGSANEKKAHELHYVCFFTSTFSDYLVAIIALFCHTFISQPLGII